MGKKVSITLKESLSKAEKNAKQRDVQSKKILSEQELQLANELLEKAQSRNMILIPEKKVKNRTRFVQLLQRNIEYLRQHNYLTSEEKVFLFDIQPFVGLNSNAIVNDPAKKEGVPVNISQLSKILARSRAMTSKVVNNLVDKGIICKAESGIEGNNTRTYSLFLNPHIFFCGDKDSVNETLKTMFIKSMNKKVLKNLPDKLF